MKITHEPDPTLPVIPEENTHLGIHLARKLKREGGTITFPEKEKKMEKIWFISDTHFGHKNILKFCPNSRPVKDVEEHDERLIKNWQEQVAPHDRVYHLGDFFFCNGERARQILDRLPGQIHFIHGNHDKVISSNHDIRSRFVSVSDYKELRIDEIKVCLFHFPIYEWHHIHYGAFHFYGHVHGSVQVPGRAMDVGVDTRPNGDMRLWSWEELKTLMLAREVRTHHNNVRM